MTSVLPSPQQWVPGASLDVFTACLPGGAAVAERLEAAWREKRTVTFQTRQITSGSLPDRWLEVRAAPHPTDGGLLLFLRYLSDRRWADCILDDTLEELQRVHAEQRYMLSKAECLLWHAYIEERVFPEGGESPSVWFDERRRTGLDWHMTVMEEDAVSRWLPVRRDTESFALDWYLSRPLEDRQRCDRTATETIQNKRSGYSQEYRCSMADGGTRWLKEDVRIEPLGPGRWRAIGVCTDITERKRAEKEREAAIKRLKNLLTELRYLLASARCMLWHATVDVRPVTSPTCDAPPFDEEGKTYLHWDLAVLEPEAVLQWLPIEGRSEHFAWDWYDACLPEDQKKMDQNALAAFRAGQSGYSQEYRCRMADGTVRWLKEDVHIEAQGEGKWLAVGVCTDITEAKQLQGQLIQTEKLASLGQLVAGVAHEINNPLSVVSALAEILKTHSDAQVQKDGATILRMCERTNRVVQSLRVFARDGHADALSPGSVNGCVHSVLEIIGHQLRKSAVALTLDLASGLPPVRMNSNQIEQVILNLVSNAEYEVRSRPLGERAIRITTALREGRCNVNAAEGGKCVMITVQDTGNGIPKAIAARIFDPFFTTKEVGQGTGLGLSICHSIIETHGGQIFVESREGEGALFTICLPPAAVFHDD